MALSGYPESSKFRGFAPTPGTWAFRLPSVCGAKIRKKLIFGMFIRRPRASPETALLIAQHVSRGWAVATAPEPGDIAMREMVTASDGDTLSSTPALTGRA
jgi:hypothetical protein